MLKDNSKQAKTMIIVIWIFIFLNIIVLLVNAGVWIYEYTAVYYPRGFRKMYAAYYAFISLLQLLLNVFATIVFIRWSFRAHRNIQLVSGSKTYNGFFIIGSWFIPVMSWFMPYKVMRRLFERTADHIGETHVPVKPVNRWWFWWLTLAAWGYFQEIVIFTYDLNGISQKTLSLSIGAMILALIVDITTIQMIKAYSAMEIKLHNRHFKDYYKGNTDDLIDQA